ncbi:MAG: DUF72 domain-containing protein [Gemmatimonadales bacterium]
MIASVRLGTQGWNYPAWIGPLYPSGTLRADMLRLYGRVFSTVEVDSTFYAIPPEPVVRAWREKVPADFKFALKVPQQVTHERRLVGVADVLTKFLDRVEQLGDRLGPLLLQLPPDFAPSEPARAVFAKFVRDLSGLHQWAVEFRDAGWITRETLSLLAKAGIALALTEGRWIRRDWMLKLAEQPTADFAYVRWLGPDRRITNFGEVQVAREDELDAWADAVRTLGTRVREVYGFANNHWQGHSPASVRLLQRRLGLPVIDPARLRTQAELFSERR